MGCSASSAIAVNEGADYEVKASVHPAKPAASGRPSALPVSRAALLPLSYDLKDTIGQGAYGVVFSATQRASHEARAVKHLPLGDLHTGCRSNTPFEAEQEARLWWRVRSHPNVVELLECYRDTHNYFMVMEFCMGGTLAERRPVFCQYPEHVVIRMFQEMLRGLSHVHAAGVVHRDLKPANFLLGGQHGKTIMLADFGLAAMKPKMGLLHGVFGSPAYMSPEMADKRGHSLATDVWSLGATCYTLLMREYPYQASSGLAKSRGEALKLSIARNLQPPTFVRVSADAASPAKESVNAETCDLEVPPSASMVEFLRRLLDRDVSTRPTAEQALQLPPLAMDDGAAEDTIGGVSETLLHLSV